MTSGAELPEAVRRGIAAFNDLRFLEAHDLLEEAWADCDGPERPLYQGLVQLAVACHHAAEGNWKGARNVFWKARLRLGDLPSDMMGIDVAGLLGQIARKEADLEKGPFPHVRFKKRET